MVKYWILLQEYYQAVWVSIQSSYLMIQKKMDHSHNWKVKNCNMGFEIPHGKIAYVYNKRLNFTYKDYCEHYYIS